MNVWLNISVCLALVGAALWLSVLPCTTFFDGD
jgi:uncharacterized membrane protein